ncbi:MAG TPA: HPr family phosphocarrier protein [Isosphaeraceae bacterium]|nr:HPr family phosphocarrier protein [Isosphaeraceae bacterium]
MSAIPWACRPRRKEVNGKSILDLATLAAACGACIDLEANGPDADAAILALAVLIEARSHEAEAQA